MVCCHRQNALTFVSEGTPYTLSTLEQSCDMQTQDPYTWLQNYIFPLAIRVQGDKESLGTILKWTYCINL